jgi:ATP synthase protein I
MTEDTGRRTRDEGFREDVTRGADRKRRARERDRSPWFGFGMFGMVGWSVALPTVLGIALGVWLDGRYPDVQISFTLTFLVLGVSAGCLIAWQWVRRESHDD